MEAAQARPVGSDRRVGHDLGARRHLCREGRGGRRAVERAGAALVGEFESVSFDIDNTAAAHRGAAGARAGHASTIAFVSATTSPPVQRVEYSLDASRWRVVYPKDGIPDSRREEFEVPVDDSEAGRSVIIRATDAMNNVATAVASWSDDRGSRPPLLARLRVSAPRGGVVAAGAPTEAFAPSEAASTTAALPPSTSQSRH